MKCTCKIDLVGFILELNQIINDNKYKKKQDLVKSINYLIDDYGDEMSLRRLFEDITSKVKITK